MRQARARVLGLVALEVLARGEPEREELHRQQQNERRDGVDDQVDHAVNPLSSAACRSSSPRSSIPKASYSRCASRALVAGLQRERPAAALARQALGLLEQRPRRAAAAGRSGHDQVRDPGVGRGPVQPRAEVQRAAAPRARRRPPPRAAPTPGSSSCARNTRLASLARRGRDLGPAELLQQRRDRARSPRGSARRTFTAGRARARPSPRRPPRSGGASASASAERNARGASGRGG